MSKSTRLKICYHITSAHPILFQPIKSRDMGSLSDGPWAVVFLLLWIQKLEKEKANVAVPSCEFCWPFQTVEVIQTNLVFWLCLPLISGPSLLLFHLIRMSSSPGQISPFRHQVACRLSHTTFLNFPQLGYYPS